MRGVETVTVRPYEQRDRAAVRDICFRTGYLGEPVGFLWPDQESFADMFAAGADLEPSSAFVAVASPPELLRDGPLRLRPDPGSDPRAPAHHASGRADRVVGYLLGFPDARREPNPALVAARHALSRGLLARPGMGAVLWRAARDLALDALRSGRVPTVPVDHERYPACFHVDLLPEARGRGVGRRLVAAFVDRLTTLGVQGCHLVTFAENAAAVAFFSSLGFEPHGRSVLAPGFRTREGARMHLTVMVRALGVNQAPERRSGRGAAGQGADARPRGDPEQRSAQRPKERHVADRP